MISRIELRIEALNLAVSQGSSDAKDIVSRAKIFYDFLSEGYKEIDNQYIPRQLTPQYPNNPDIIPRTHQNHCQNYWLNKRRQADGRSFI